MKANKKKAHAILHEAIERVRKECGGLLVSKVFVNRDINSNARESSTTIRSDVEVIFSIVKVKGLLKMERID